MKNTEQLSQFISDMVRTKKEEAENRGESFSMREFGEEIGVTHATVSRWISGILIFYPSSLLNRMRL